ncbi:MAG: hypothetical protein M1835_003587 [Candelina submexicana]|nr:MAG: hypothetical protein M1835_003587 [Candelina submexicana]
MGHSSSKEHNPYGHYGSGYPPVNERGLSGYGDMINGFSGSAIENSIGRRGRHSEGMRGYAAGYTDDRRPSGYGVMPERFNTGGPRLGRFPGDGMRGAPYIAPLRLDRFPGTIEGIGVGDGSFAPPRRSRRPRPGTVMSGGSPGGAFPNPLVGGGMGGGMAPLGGGHRSSRRGSNMPRESSHRSRHSSHVGGGGPGAGAGGRRLMSSVRGGDEERQRRAGGGSGTRIG